MNGYRFHNGTDELNITDAHTNSWIDSDLRYYDGEWKDIYVKQTPFQADPDKTTISPWEGIFIKSYKDNITLIRQN